MRFALRLIMSVFVFGATLPASLSAAEPPAVTTKSRKIVSDVGVAAPVSTAPAAAVKKDETLGVVNSTPVTSVNSTSVVPGAPITPVGSSLGGITSAGMAIAQSPVSTTTTITPAVPQDSSASLQMMAAVLQGAMAMFGGNSNAQEDKAQKKREDQAQIDSAGLLFSDAVQSANGFPGMPALPETCVICAENQASKDPIFQACSPGNDWMEDALTKAQGQGLELAKPSRKSLACIADSMRNSGIDNYQYCPNPEGQGATTRKRPCASEAMVRTVASAYELTSECLADYVAPGAATDPRLKAGVRSSFFQLMNWESNFNMNSVSGTGAAGMGQFTAGAVQNLNTSEFSGMIGRLKSSSNPACQALGTKNYSMMSTKDCSAISLANGNPQLNMMYTLMHMKSVRDTASQVLSSSNVQISPAMRATLLEQLSVWGHNVGSGGIGQVLKIAIAKNGSLLAQGDDPNPFLRVMQADMITWQTKNGAGVRRVDEATGFLYRTKKRLKESQDRVGGCGA